MSTFFLFSLPQQSLNARTIYATCSAVAPLMQRSSSCWPSECGHMGVVVVKLDLCWCHLSRSCVNITCRPCLAFWIQSRNEADLLPCSRCLLSPLSSGVLLGHSTLYTAHVSWFDGVALLFVDFVRISSHLPQYAHFSLIYCIIIGARPRSINWSAVLVFGCIFDIITVFNEG